MITCIGRTLPADCYLIDITFEPKSVGAAKAGYLLGALVLFAIAGYMFTRSVRQRKVRVSSRDAETPVEDVETGNLQPDTNNLNIASAPDVKYVEPDSRNADVFHLGGMIFDARARALRTHGNTIELTKTETRVLRMFALTPNEVVERSRLQKEIWEDDGVIVGRSLDMFISKLRKKLEGHPNVRIVVIRGKGYRLDISA
ncbi:MAG: winged helix family transcriptional regulator [Sphingobacteriales bacterium]|nr:MAG: winged helix family transcriptional regulator [Sphingobacteriales bacterium]